MKRMLSAIIVVSAVAMLGLLAAQMYTVGFVAMFTEVQPMAFGVRDAAFIASWFVTMLAGCAYLCALLKE